MEAIEALKTRRSCRVFTDEQLREEDLQTILDCGLNAPSGSNKQDTKIIVVQDAEKIKALSDLSRRVTNIKTDPFYGAKTVCLVVAPEDSGYKEPEYQLNPVKNAALVIGAMQTAAFAIGVGSCWVNSCMGILEQPEGKALLEKLGLTGYFGVGCCVLGYPAKAPAAKKIKAGRVLHF